ncbi:hypothetical protein Tco_1404370 [Tanacetum coccineum]
MVAGGGEVDDGGVGCWGRLLWRGWRDEATFTSVDVDVGGAATTDIGLEASQGSGTMHNTPTRPHDSPLPRVHIIRSNKGSLQQNELMDLVTKLI